MPATGVNAIISKELNQIDDVYDKFNKYMVIVKKTACDMVPKAIKWYIIDELNKFIITDLKPSLYYPNEKLVSSTISASITKFRTNVDFILGGEVCNRARIGRRICQKRRKTPSL